MEISGWFLVWIKGCKAVEPAHPPANIRADYAFYVYPGLAYLERQTAQDRRCPAEDDPVHSVFYSKEVR